jgi:hypothetical protein
MFYELLPIPRRIVDEKADPCIDPVFSWAEGAGEDEFNNMRDVRERVGGKNSST